VGDIFYVSILLNKITFGESWPTAVAELIEHLILGKMLPIFLRQFSPQNSPIRKNIVYRRSYICTPQLLSKLPFFNYPAFN